ncbi:MAG: hypothetical protein J7M12_02105, partial [Candidatus Hydrogenedentes bacterium]|nr:hypothetical protein [Candidatus Hydrogenedentota bacterium]
KHYRTVRLVDRLFFSVMPSRSRAEREWRVIGQIKKRAPDIFVPNAVAVGRRSRRGLIRESWLVLDEIAETEPLGDLLERDSVSESVCKSLVVELGRLTARVAAVGLVHRDYHLGNILVVGKPARCRLALIDLHAARVGRRSCTGRRLERMVARMWYSLETCGIPAERCRVFAETVLGTDSPAVDRVRRLVTRVKLRHWRSRSKRCMKNSTMFEQGVLPDGRYSVSREFGLERLRRAVELHRAGSDGTVLTLKKSGQGHVTRVDLNGYGQVCVKEVRAVGIRKWIKTIVRQGRGRRAWTAVNGLAARGFAVPRPCGLMVDRNGPMKTTEYVVTQYLDKSPTLQDYVETREYGESSPARKRAFTDAFARYLAMLHTRGVHQHDFKGNNVLVEETDAGGWTFYLVDLDAVEFTSSVSKRRRVKNLAQLASALSNRVNAAQRFRFLRAYTRAAQVEWNERTVVRRVIKMVKERGGPWRVPTVGGG